VRRTHLSRPFYNARISVASLSRERGSVQAARAIAEQAFSRAAGAPLIAGNRIRLLRDATENYPAWLEAIHSARHHVHFEMYIIHEDSAGQMFADALIAKAQEGVRVRLAYDWMGGFGKASRKFWNRLRAGGVEVRCYNPPRFDSPLGWLSRDHRKTIVVDGEIGFVSGLCVGKAWIGDRERKIKPWRDTGIEVHGPAVAEIERAFAQVWDMTGEPLPHDESPKTPSCAGDVSLRIVASLPATTGMFRLDQLMAAMARRSVWLTDAYYAGTSPYVQALRAAARDGVDVRLLVPNATDIPILRPLSRAGYRPLLEAGVRVFEWNGPMVHAKTAVVDGQWSRVGSTNLNIASWLGNCELDAVIEDEGFAQQMEAMYKDDLTNATEVVLDRKQKARALGEPKHPMQFGTSRGSASRAAAGAMRIGNALGAAFTNRRVLEPVEARLLAMTGLLLLGLATLIGFFPKAFAYPVVVILAWIGLVLWLRAFRLYRQGSQQRRARKDNAASAPLF
jgi:cardiolipin synthase